MSRVTEIFESGELFDSRYKLLELLSTSGGTADVWLAIDTNTIDDAGSENEATKVVIKVYRPKNLLDIDGEYQFRSEFKKVFNCHHENIIQPANFSIYEEMPYLVLPYCPAGSSEMMVGSFQKADDIWKYIYEVASGLAYLHEHIPQIIHQDIKPANVLIDDNGNYAITDFGISAAMGVPESEMEESAGTFAYMAPERFIEGMSPMPESDIWALGATLFELVTGTVPFGEDGGSIQQKESAIPEIKQKIPDSIKQLIYSCLAFDIKNRPTARSIVDTVLKKRYTSNRPVMAFIAAGLLVIAAGLTFFLFMGKQSNPEEHLNSLVVSADSIIETQTHNIKMNGDVPTTSEISELKKAVVFFNKVLNDAPENYSKKDSVIMKINTVNELINCIEEYGYTNDLVENARLTEMEDSVMKYSFVLENQRSNINQLIQKLK